MNDVKIDLINVKSDLNDVKIDLSNVESDLNDVKTDLSNVKIDVKKLGNKVDGDVIPKLQSTLDGYSQNYEAIKELKTLVNKNTEDISQINVSLNEMKEDLI
ncbi:MAG: hypothetical protein Q8900_07720 [Bacillota bacterium]|nr:hypothetical protein [Bacillota bacterium]